MEFRGSEISRRLRKRRPLTDVSNAVTASVKLKENSGAKPKSRAIAVHDEIPIGGETSSIGSCNSENSSSRKAGPSSSGSTVADPPVNSGVADRSVLEPVVLYTRQSSRRQKSKRKADWDPLQSSCPPPKRIRSVGDNQMKASEDADCLAAASSVPYPKSKRKWRYMLSSDSRNQPQALLPQQFIDEQRAYFAEVDAFQLPEEVVSETELE
ncbi:unnamed protein product [Spirodela intermedia]|uniref:Sororin C-terminal region domain-containing protein n=1 Tax=Spirodela intermedia TaxID=51605 RepID=A0A7I8JH64_SPIIN|nr:unnamed protein product [Spirodela intermedia]CAA6669271.1 unnamed protein product [Spirodela intermedia]